MNTGAAACEPRLCTHVEGTTRSGGETTDGVGQLSAPLTAGRARRRRRTADRAVRTWRGRRAPRGSQRETRTVHFQLVPIAGPCSSLRAVRIENVYLTAFAVRCGRNYELGKPRESRTRFDLGVYMTAPLNYVKIDPACVRGNKGSIILVNYLAWSVRVLRAFTLADDTDVRKKTLKVFLKRLFKRDYRPLVISLE